jgi:hypothetical protein
MRQGRVSIRDKQIAVARDGVEKTISHCVAHNLQLDPTFNVEQYIHICRLMLEDALIPDYLIEDILDEAETAGLLEATFPMGRIAQNGAAQIHPFLNEHIKRAINQLQKLFVEVM